MAGRDIGAIEPVGGNRGAQNAAPVRQAQAQAPQGGTANRAQDGAPQTQDGGRNEETRERGERPPAEGVELSDNARAQLQADENPQVEENRQAEEQQENPEDEKLKQLADDLQRKAQELEAELARPKEERDQNKIQGLLRDIQGLQQEFDNLTGVARNPIGNAAQNTAPAGGGGVGNAGGGGGGFAPPLLGNPYGGGAGAMGGGFPGGGGAGAMGGGAPMAGGQQPAPPANPNVQIPDFGKNPSKAEINTMLEAASKKHGIPPNILKAVAWQESTWNPKALSFDGQHGKGVMQIDDRFHEFAKTPDVFDPKKNIEYGANYLSNLYKETGSWTAALKRYNGGSSYPPKILALAERQPWQQYV